MHPELKQYLRAKYRRDVFGESAEVKAPKATPDVIAAIKAEIAAIDALKLGANLANRDFALYQRRKALEELLTQLEVTGRLVATERSADRAGFTGTKS